jgi:hypothetical protein
MKNSHIHNGIAAYFIAIFFLLMLIFPSQYQFERGFFLVILLYSSLLFVTINPKSWRINRELLVVSCICLFVSLFSISHGLYLDNPGALPLISVYMVWPLLFIWIIGLPNNQATMFLMIKTIIIGSLSIGMIIILTVIGPLFGLNGMDFLEIFSVRSGVFAESIKISSPMTPVLFFFLPFSICLLLINKQIPVRYFSASWRRLLVLALILTVINLIITGRSVFWLVALVSVFLVMFIIRCCKLKRASIISYFLYFLLFSIFLFGLSLIVSESLLVFDISVYFDLFVEKIFHISDPGSVGYRRYEQLMNLLEGFYSSPLFGQGLGAVEFNGSDVWQFELSYVALLFQVGLIGVILYVLSFVWLFLVLVKLSRNNLNIAILAAPMLSGLLGFLLANATNPLLGKFDFLWVIFLPLALVNYGLRQNKSAGLFK